MQATMTSDPLAALPPAHLAQNAKAPRSLAEAFSARDAIIEPKYDGWRMLAHVTDEGVRLYSRTGNRYDGALPLVEGELLANFPAGTWLDGEAVAMTVEADRVNIEWGVAQSVLSRGGNGNLHPLHSRVTYVAFDVLAHPTIAPVLAQHVGIDATDSDLRGYPLRLRRAALDACFRNVGMRHVALAPMMEATEASHDANLAQGFEGSIVKSLDATYRSGQRGAGWFKLKPQTTIDAIIMGYQEGRNGFSGLVGAIIFGQYDAEGRLVERGRCSGMDMRTRIAISENRDEHLGRVVEIAHMGVSVGQGESGRFRHPQFKRFRDDRLPETVEIHDA